MNTFYLQIRQTVDTFPVSQPTLGFCKGELKSYVTALITDEYTLTEPAVSGARTKEHHFHVPLKHNHLTPNYGLYD